MSTCYIYENGDIFWVKETKKGVEKGTMQNS